MPRTKVATIQTSTKNQFLNSDFTIAQRTGGFTTAFTSVRLFNDRWRSDAISVSGMSHVVSTLPSGFPGDSRITRAARLVGTSTAANSLAAHQQRVESVVAKEMTSNIISCGFWIYASNFTEIQFQVLKPNVADNYGSGNTVVSIVNVPIDAENTWQFVKLENIDLGDRSNGYLVAILFLNPTNPTGAFDTYVTQAMCNEGPVVEPWSLREGNAAAELVACQRYYEKSYRLSVRPGTPSDFQGAIRMRNGNITSIIFMPGQFNTPKRVSTYTFQIWSPDNGSNNIYDDAADANRPGSASVQSEQGFTIRSTSNTTGNNALHSVQWTADAEIP